MGMMKLQGGSSMVSKYTNKELDALENKLENPEQTVICPRCGNVLLYASVGNCAEARCAPDGCIRERVRGL